MSSFETEVSAISRNVVEIARKKRARICFAESLTGGLLASSIVSVPGASDVFSVGVVAYQLSAKESILGVSGALLDAEGAVHPLVAEQMAHGAVIASRSPEQSQNYDWEIGVATTGVAGPGPDGVTGQSAGTVWIGSFVTSFDTASDPDRTKGDATSFLFPGSRQEVRESAVLEALKITFAILESL